eukprot:IDg10181t1
MLSCALYIPVLLRSLRTPRSVANIPKVRRRITEFCATSTLFGCHCSRRFAPSLCDSTFACFLKLGVVYCCLLSLSSTSPDFEPRFALLSRWLPLCQRYHYRDTVPMPQTSHIFRNTSRTAGAILLQRAMRCCLLEVLGNRRSTISQRIIVTTPGGVLADPLDLALVPDVFISPFLCGFTAWW